MLESEDRTRTNSAGPMGKPSKYSDTERRKGERRDRTDRRDVHRLEGKVSRRTGRGRRKGEKFGLFLKDVAKK